MPGTILTPPNPLIIPTSITGPADGDPITAASVNTAFRPLMGGMYSTLLLAQGVRPGRKVFCADGDAITVGALGAFAVTVNGVWTVLENNGTYTFSAKTVFGGDLVALTRYYVYAGVSLGALAFLVTTTPPDSTRRFITGSTDWVFVTTLLTDSTKLAIPFTLSGGYYQYATSNILASETRFLNLGSGTDVNFIDVSLGNFVPPYAGMVQFSTAITTGNTDWISYFAVNTSGTRFNLATGGAMNHVFRVGGAITTETHFWTMPVFNGSLSYRRVGVSASASVLGWSEV